LNSLLGLTINKFVKTDTRNPTFLDLTANGHPMFSQQSIIAEEFPQFMPLAYNMDHTMDSKKHSFKEAYFGWVKFEVPVAAIANVKTSLEKTPSIIRHLIIKTVRENTMYSPKVSGVAGKTTDKAEGEVADATVAEGESKASGNEIDKSIDALVIS
jgi:hypothetical protein